MQNYYTMKFRKTPEGLGEDKKSRKFKFSFYVQIQTRWDQ